MNRRSRLATFILLAALSSGFTLAQNQQKSATTEPAVRHATGTLEVKLSPQASADLPQGVIGRMSIDKTFHGGLEGTSKGEMLAAGSGEKGSSGGYVALEQFTGTLNGRKGSFVLQHTATMMRGTPQLSITVVPDSGTGELVGITGKMNITIADGKHSYDFEYTLAPK